VVLYDIPDIERCPRVQECASYGRLVTWATEAAGNRSGTAGANIGKAQLKWAFSDAALVGLRDHPAGQNFLARWAKPHRTGKAVTLVAHQWARAVYDRVKRPTAFDRHTCLPAEGRGGGELNASLDSWGMSRFTNARP
jgi:hypothetical protein